MPVYAEISMKIVCWYLIGNLAIYTTHTKVFAHLLLKVEGILFLGSRLLLH